MPNPKTSTVGKAPMANSTADAKLMTIGALAKACHLTVRTLRYYEEMDLIQADSRTEGGYRLYNLMALKRVNAILALQELNFSLERIGDMLGTAAQHQQLATKAQRIAKTRQRLKVQEMALSEKRRRLMEMQTMLTERLNALDAICTPCEKHAPQADEACLSCEHQAVHQT
jgi:MerR family transcriptional regulator, copper efflux regulator